MLVVKKTLVMGSADDRRVSGLLKLEYFRERTTCAVQLYGMDEGYICVRADQDVILCAPLGMSEYETLPSDLQGEVQAIVLQGDQVVCSGSNRGIGFAYGNFATAARERIRRQDFVPQFAAEQAQESADDETDADMSSDVEPTQTMSNASAQSIDASDMPVDADVAAVQPQPMTGAPEAERAQESTSERQTREPVGNKRGRKTKPRDNGDPFYTQVRTQLDEIMRSYPEDAELQALVTDSRWVRVPVADDDYYVVGVVSPLDRPRVICYGVPDADGKHPPECSNACRQWMELEKGGRGYWMMYQDADSGEILTDLSCNA